MNTDNIYIDSNDITSAYDLCKNITDNDIKSRAVENVVAANIADRFFDKSLYSVDSKSGLHNLVQILEDIDISDIYINGAYVDVRMYEEGSSPSIPSSHFKNGILPVAYMFIKVSSELSNASLAGFILPEAVELSDDDYIRLDETSLVSIYDVETRFGGTADADTVSELEIFKFAEGTVEDRFDLYKRLILSKGARELLKKAFLAQSVFNFISPQLPQEELPSDEQAIIDAFDNFDEVIPEELGDEEAQPTNENYEYNTVASPSEYEEEFQEANDEQLESVQENVASDDSEQIDALFEQEQDTPEEHAPAKKKVSPVLIIALLIALVGALGFWGYTTYSQNQEQSVEEEITADELQGESGELPAEQPQQATSAMPVEDVNTVKSQQAKDEANSVQIPEIERNLDASVLVSNLKVDWEVPSGYASNAAAKRYLVKLGKVIQLNLKTELLLLTKPPISNRIAVEVKYNSSSQKFEPVGITASSGEKSVDDVIMQTVKKALNMRINANTSSFDRLQGNPVLIIHL